MIVNSFTFALFFIIVFVGYYGVFNSNVKSQNWWLLCCSLFSYWLASKSFVILLFFCTILYYGLGRIIVQMKNRKFPKFFMLFGVLFGILILLYFKYLNFFIDSFSVIFQKIGFETQPHFASIVIPVGISFFTFKLIAYVVDVYNGKVEVCKDYVEFANYISFFPTILSGPIDRPKSLLEQMREKRLFDYHNSAEGCRQILWGLFKKMIVADGLAEYVHCDIETSGGSTLLLAALLYSIQIYTDFSGYSDMAIGVGKLLGFRITRNFNNPYFSRSVSEFWKRWHISLMEWLKEYVYFPLGGSRLAKVKTIRNTIIVFLISGLWHGANWTFVLWGIYHAVLFLPGLLFKGFKRYKVSTPYNWSQTLNVIVVFTLVTNGWIIFRCEDLGQVYNYFSNILDTSLFSVPNNLAVLFVPIIGSLFMFVTEWLNRENEVPVLIPHFKLLNNSNVRIVLYALFFVLITIYGGTEEQFIYFQF